MAGRADSEVGEDDVQITEASLRLLPCPPDVMLGQFAWLERFLSLGLGNIALGIVPMGVELAIVPTTDFLLLDAQAIVETHAGEAKADELDSAKYAEIFDMLMAESLTGDDARRLIMAAADDLRRSKLRKRRSDVHPSNPEPGHESGQPGHDAERSRRERLGTV